MLKELLERHIKEFKGLLKGPTRVEMPKEGKNIVPFNNYHKQMKVPYVIYADFEALIRKIPLCKRKEWIKESYTEKTDWHKACRYAYSVVRNDGFASTPKVYGVKMQLKGFLWI